MEYNMCYSRFLMLFHNFSFTVWGRHGKLTPTLLIFAKVDSHAIFGQLSWRSIFLEGAGFHLKTTLEKKGDVKNVYE